MPRNTQFSCYDMVELASDIPDAGLKTGTRGAIVLVHTQPQEAYEVEFVDIKGTTIGVITVEPQQLKRAQ